MIVYRNTPSPRVSVLELAIPLLLQNSPAKQDGLEVVNPINRLLETVSFDKVVYSLDWHPRNHVSFFSNLKLRPTKQIQSTISNNQTASVVN